MIRYYVKLYAEVCCGLIFSIFVLGFLVPALVSADDTFLVLVGVTLMLAVPPVVGILAWHIYKHLKQQLEDKSHE